MSQQDGRSGADAPAPSGEGGTPSSGRPRAIVPVDDGTVVVGLTRLCYLVFGFSGLPLLEDPMLPDDVALTLDDCTELGAAVWLMLRSHPNVDRVRFRRTKVVVIPSDGADTPKMFSQFIIGLSELMEGFVFTCDGRLVRENTLHPSAERVPLRLMSCRSILRTSSDWGRTPLQEPPSAKSIAGTAVRGLVDLARARAATASPC